MRSYSWSLTDTSDDAQPLDMPIEEGMGPTVTQVRRDADAELNSHKPVSSTPWQGNADRDGASRTITLADGSRLTATITKD